jgi:hypothetical protein
MDIIDETTKWKKVTDLICLLEEVNKGRFYWIEGFMG